MAVMLNHREDLSQEGVRSSEMFERPLDSLGGSHHESEDAHHNHDDGAADGGRARAPDGCTRLATRDGDVVEEEGDGGIATRGGGENHHGCGVAVDNKRDDEANIIQPDRLGDGHDDDEVVPSDDGGDGAGDMEDADPDPPDPAGPRDKPPSVW